MIPVIPAKIRYWKLDCDDTAIRDRIGMCDKRWRPRWYIFTFHFFMFHYKKGNGVFRQPLMPDYADNVSVFRVWWLHFAVDAPCNESGIVFMMRAINANSNILLHDQVRSICNSLVHFIHMQNISSAQISRIMPLLCKITFFCHEFMANFALLELNNEMVDSFAPQHWHFAGYNCWQEPIYLYLPGSHYFEAWIVVLLKAIAQVSNNFQQIYLNGWIARRPFFWLCVQRIFWYLLLRSFQHIFLRIQSFIIRKSRIAKNLIDYTWRKIFNGLAVYLEKTERQIPCSHEIISQQEKKQANQICNSEHQLAVIFGFWLIHLYSKSAE